MSQELALVDANVRHLIYGRHIGGCEAGNETRLVQAYDEVLYGSMVVEYAPYLLWLAHRSSSIKTDTSLKVSELLKSLKTVEPQ